MGSLGTPNMLLTAITTFCNKIH